MLSAVDSMPPVRVYEKPLGYKSVNEIAQMINVNTQDIVEIVKRNKITPDVLYEDSTALYSPKKAWFLLNEKRQTGVL